MKAHLELGGDFWQVGFIYLKYKIVGYLKAKTEFTKKLLLI